MPRSFASARSCAGLPSVGARSRVAVLSLLLLALLGSGTACAAVLYTEHATWHEFTQTRLTIDIDLVVSDVPSGYLWEYTLINNNFVGSEYIQPVGDYRYPTGLFYVDTEYSWDWISWYVDKYGDLPPAVTLDWQETPGWRNIPNGMAGGIYVDGPFQHAWIGPSGDILHPSESAKFRVVTNEFHVRRGYISTVIADPFFLDPTFPIMEERLPAGFFQGRFATPGPDAAAEIPEPQSAWVVLAVMMIFAGIRRAC